MNNIIFNNTKIAAYHLWEHYQNVGALNLWYCSEDIAHHIEVIKHSNSIDFSKLLTSDKISFEYIFFVRQIAFRIYMYTDCKDDIKNWYVAENLLANNYWYNAILTIATEFGKSRKDSILVSSIRSDNIKNYYQNVYE